MDVQKQDDLIKEAFEIEAEEIGFCLDQLWGDYENPYENSDTALAFNLFKKGWLAKAQAVPDLGELQERIAGHQYYHDEHGHMIVDMDDVVKEISGFDSWKAQAVPEGYVLVEKAKLMQIIGSVSMIEPITRGNPYMDSVKRELTAITDVVKTVIEAQEPAND